MSKVMVFGTFDGLHRGHIDFLSQAMAFAEKMIVVVSRDKNVYKIKGHYPKYSEKTRLIELKEKYKKNRKVKFILGQIRNPYRIVERNDPDTICLGYDQAGFALDLKNFFPTIEVFRLKPYFPQKYKSSILNKL